MGEARILLRDAAGLTATAPAEVERKLTVLFVTHSIAEAIKIGNRILLLSPHPGRVKAEVIDVDRVSSEDGSAGRLEKQIHDLLFADAVTAH